jgi:ribosomal protein S18 acetylase RimI-like enzyme
MNTCLPIALQPPDQAIRIRPVRISDTSALNDVCWPERSHGSVYQLILRAHRNARQGRGLGIVVVDQTDNTILKGYGQLTLWPQCGEVSDLIIGASYRRQGLGTAIIQYLVRSAREMHVPYVEIGAATRNHGAIALYRRLGFQDDHTITLNLGEGRESVLFLRLSLTDSTIES